MPYCTKSWNETGVYLTMRNALLYQKLEWDWGILNYASCLTVPKVGMRLGSVASAVVNLSHSGAWAKNCIVLNTSCWAVVNRSMSKELHCPEHKLLGCGESEHEQRTALSWTQVVGLWWIWATVIHEQRTALSWTQVLFHQPCPHFLWLPLLFLNLTHYNWKTIFFFQACIKSYTQWNTKSKMAEKSSLPCCFSS